MNKAVDLSSNFRNIQKDDRGGSKEQKIMC